MTQYKDWYEWGVKRLDERMKDELIKYIECKKLKEEIEEEVFIQNKPLTFGTKYVFIKNERMYQRHLDNIALYIKMQDNIKRGLRQ